MTKKRKVSIRQRLTYEAILAEIKLAVGEMRYKETYPLIKVLASRLLEEDQYWAEIEKLLSDDISEEDFRKRDSLSRRAADLSRTIATLFKIIGFSPESSDDKMDRFDDFVKSKSTEKGGE